MDNDNFLTEQIKNILNSTIQDPLNDISEGCETLVESVKKVLGDSDEKED